MYFWKIQGLKNEIRAGNLSEKDRFIYAFIYFVLTAIAFELMVHIPTEYGNVWDAIDSISSILIVTIGTLFAFRSNGGAAGNDFLGKYFSIGFVVIIRFLPILVGMGIAQFFYYLSSFPEDLEIPSTFFDTVPFILWYLALYWRICKHIRDVKIHNKSVELT